MSFCLTAIREGNATSAAATSRIANAKISEIESCGNNAGVLQVAESFFFFFFEITEAALSRYSVL